MDSYLINKLIEEKHLLGSSQWDGSRYVVQVASLESTAFYEEMRQQGFTHGQILEMIDNMEVYLNAEVAEHLSKLVKERDTTTYRMEQAGLSGRAIREVMSGKRIGKDTLFGVCLFLELSEEEVEEFLRIRGIRLTDSITDKTFRTFIKQGRYRLMDFVEACRLLAEEVGATLPEFYDRGYLNMTYKK